MTKWDHSDPSSAVLPTQREEKGSSAKREDFYSFSKDEKSRSGGSRSTPDLILEFIKRFIGVNNMYKVRVTATFTHFFFFLFKEKKKKKRLLLKPKQATQLNK